MPNDAERASIAPVRHLGDLPGVGVGHATLSEGLSGCTVVAFADGAVAGHAACGVASGSRELATITPRHTVERIHAICLSGGSAYGLAAAQGVMDVLEQAGIGHKTGAGLVPIVPGAVVYDLHHGAADVRPGPEQGRLAAEAALVAATSGVAAQSGNVGAGTGISAGKLLGASLATKTGIGQGGGGAADGLAAAALAVVNPVGDVLHPLDGRILAGTRAAADSDQLVGTGQLVRRGAHVDPLHGNTTLVVAATNAKLTRVEAAWVAEQAMVALARQIEPPFTRHDGDVVFVASVGDVEADLHRVGVLCREAVSWALVDGCTSAEPAAGLPSGETLRQP
jgi:L-aminopeptidase/D-esterase-like protein